MSDISQQQVLEALAQVIDRDAGQDVVAAGMISGIAIRESKVGFLITIEPKDKDRKAYLREACEAAVKKIPGIGAVTAVLTAQANDPIPPSPQSGYAQPRERAVWNLTPVEGVKQIIAVASGKGGVGKSTTTVNLALAMQRLDKRVGILDADIYGPSIPRMLGLSGKPEIVDGKMVPLHNHGIACMSVGFITGDEAAILRGPMISKTLTQMLRFTRWDGLDMLLVDMPPGTGDVHLSMAQQVPLSGAVIVTTPQEVAVADARKCAIMFTKVGVKLLGVIENMSGELFGSGGGKLLADELHIPLLGDIPAEADIRATADRGKAYAGAQAALYQDIAKKLG